jgi:hypothetical protein
MRSKAHSVLTAPFLLYFFTLQICTQPNYWTGTPIHPGKKILYSTPDQSKFAFEGKQELELPVAGPRGILLL